MAPTDPAEIMLDVLARLGDVVGEKSLRSLLLYAASEVGSDQGALPARARTLEGALADLGPALGASIDLVARDGERIVLRVRATGDDRLQRAREALITGLVTGFERRRTGIAPAVEFKAGPAPVARSRDHA